ncbi:MAG: 2-amino-4-hydroxy-6-hydroxymethyldihydropteridine diphosphokinase [Gammaproteobacteria bacterium]
MAMAYIGLGSNLDDPESRIMSAILSISQFPGTTLLGRSSCYRSKPLGPQDQPEYINAVVQVDTSLGVEQLLEYLQGVENRQGRVRTQRWGPRTLDLDLLLFDDLVAMSDDLTLPHPEMHKRGFVLYPLHEIAPEIEIPGRGPVRDLLRGMDPSRVQKLERT